MLRRYLGITVYEDSTQPLLCSHCNQPMDPYGDHATICKHGFGVVHRHNTLRNTLARHVLKGTGLSYTIEAPFLIPHTSSRPTDILVQPTPPPTGEAPGRPTAYDITVRSPYIHGKIRQAALRRAGAAEEAESDKVRTIR